MRCLYHLKAEQFENFVENELHLDNWMIRADTIQHRLDMIKDSKKFEILKSRAKMVCLKFNDTEIVSWFDSMNILYHTLARITDKSLLDDLVILQEFCIPFTNKRADYLLVYENKVMVVEFSFENLGYEFRYETKLRQAISYKELLGIILPAGIDICTYTFMIDPEEDSSGTEVYVDKKGNTSNEYKMDAFSECIETFFNKYRGLAIGALSKF